MNLSDDQLKNYAMRDIQDILENNENSLMNISPEMYPGDILIKGGHNKLIVEELNYDRDSLTIDL